MRCSIPIGKRGPVNLTYSRWTSSLPSCLWSQRIFPSLPGSRLTIFYRDASSALLQLVNQWLNFTYLLTFPRFPLRKKEHKSYFGKNRTHDFRTSRCADYLLDHSCLKKNQNAPRPSLFPTTAVSCTSSEMPHVKEYSSQPCFTSTRSLRFQKLATSRKALPLQRIKLSDNTGRGRYVRHSPP